MRWIVGYAPGGGNDIVARLMGQWFSERLGQPFVIENRPGAATNMAAEAVVHAAPDGYTLLLVGQPNAINATLYETLNFNFIRDIAPVAGIMTVPNVMVVNPSFPAQTVPEFIAYAKANPGKVNMASAGNGSAAHLAGELFMSMTGISMVHVPYRGQAPAIADVLAGQVQVLFATSPASMEYVKAGKLRALAVTTSVRAEALPDLPTVGDFVPGYEASAWYGVGAPQQYPRRDHRAAEQGSQCRPRRCQAEGPAGRPRRHPDSRLARRLRQAHRRGDREVGQGHPRGQHQAVDIRHLDRSASCGALLGASPGPADGSHLAAAAAAAEEAIAAVGLEPRDADARRHIEPLEDLARSRIDAPQLALVAFPGAVPQLAVRPR